MSENRGYHWDTNSHSHKQGYEIFESRLNPNHRSTPTPSYLIVLHIPTRLGVPPCLTKFIDPKNHRNPSVSRASSGRPKCLENAKENPTVDGKDRDPLDHGPCQLNLRI